MWYAVLILLVLDIGGLLLIYVLLRDRVRRAASSDSQIAEIRDEVSRLLVELNQTTDRNIALMEDKVASLNELLSAADKKIGLIRRETEKHDVGTQVYSRLAEGRSRGGRAQTSSDAGMPPQSRQEREGVAAGMPQPRQEREGVAAQEVRQVTEGTVPERSPVSGGQPTLAVELSEKADFDSGRAAGRAGQRQERQGASAGQPRQEREEVADRMPQPRQEREGVADRMPPGVAGSADLQQRVMMLHKAGFAASLIAGRVGVPLGEVELIIALEQRKGQL